MYIRFQTRHGGGLFHAISGCDRWTPVGSRLSRADLAELVELKRWLWDKTPGPPAGAYDDRATGSPRTWFKSSAREHLAAAWRIQALVARSGLRIRSIHTRDLHILWEDDVQVIARAHSSQAPIRPETAVAPQIRWTQDRTTIRRWPSRRPIRGPPCSHRVAPSLRHSP